MHSILRPALACYRPSSHYSAASRCSHGYPDLEYLEADAATGSVTAGVLGAMDWCDISLATSQFLLLPASMACFLVLDPIPMNIRACFLMARMIDPSRIPQTHFKVLDAALHSFYLFKYPNVCKHTSCFLSHSTSKYLSITFSC